MKRTYSNPEIKVMLLVEEDILTLSEGGKEASVSWGDFLNPPSAT